MQGGSDQCVGGDEYREEVASLHGDKGALHPKVGRVAHELHDHKSVSDHDEQKISVDGAGELPPTGKQQN